MSDCFNFRIIVVDEGVEVIDPSVSTAYASLEPAKMLEYIEMDECLAKMERLKDKAKKKRQRRRLGNLLRFTGGR